MCSAESFLSLEVIRYKRIVYNFNVMRQSAYLVIYPFTVKNFVALFNWGGGGIAQWTTDQGVPGSRHGRVAVRCGLEQVTITPCLVLVKQRKQWTYD